MDAAGTRDEATRLLAQAAAGDQDALGEFVRLTQADVWRFCAAMLSREQADDATQETFLRVWRSAGGFRAESSAKTWTLAIAKRVCGDAIRRRQRAADLAERQVTRLRPVNDHGEAVALQDLVIRLHPDRRSAFVLTQLLGLSYEETAEVAGVAIGTVRSRVARARQDLQDWSSGAPRRGAQEIGGN